MLNNLGPRPTFSDVHGYVQSEVFDLKHFEKVPPMVMADFMGAINNNYRDTRDSILRDSLTPYSQEERACIADGAI